MNCESVALHLAAAGRDLGTAQPLGWGRFTGGRGQRVTQSQTHWDQKPHEGGRACAHLQ